MSYIVQPKNKHKKTAFISNWEADIYLLFSFHQLLEER